MRFISYYQVLLQATLPLKLWLGLLVNVGGSRSVFNLPAYQLGLGDYEVRSWTGWHRHVTLVLAAGAFLSVLRSQAEPLGDLSTPPFFSPHIGAGSLVAFKAARGLSFGSA